MNHLIHKDTAKGVLVYTDYKSDVFSDFGNILMASYAFEIFGYLYDEDQCLLLHVIKSRSRELTPELMNWMFPIVPVQDWNIIDSKHISIDCPETALIWRLSL